MDIRDTETIKKYNEAKAFVEWYESEYHKQLNRGDFFDSDIWEWRYEIMYRYERLKKLGQLHIKQHPYNIQIKNRIGYIKEELKKRFNKK